MKSSPQPADTSTANPTNEKDAHISGQLLEMGHADAAVALQQLASRFDGLTQAEAGARLKQYGLNVIAREQRLSALMRLLSNVKNPLVLLLIALGVLSFMTGDLRATVVIFVMVILGTVLRFVQEMRADNAAAKLEAMVSNTATLVRDGKEKEVPLKMLVPGDIIRLAAGDMTPADVRVLSAKDLFLNQAALTGESLPVEKKADVAPADVHNPLELANICFLGTNVESGAATAVVICTGKQTYLGSLAASIVGQRQLTSFDKGINKFTWLMILFIAVMVPTVFLLNGLSKHNWTEAFLFAMAVAVGLTPEMLPMIVTVNLSKGALAMARKKVIVKRLNAIQNFGAMDVLCTDKTGTITQGKIVLEKHLDVNGEDSEKVLHFGYLNSFHHTGLKNLLDEAILKHEELEQHLQVQEKYRKIDEIPFDFVRRRMSVVVEDESGLNTLICKGAVEEVLSLCTRVELNGEVIAVQAEHDTRRRQLADELNGQGFRVIALAYKQMQGASDEPVYAVKDESDLILLGFLAFLDPPKDTAAEALKRLHRLNVDVKILTGDNEIVTSYICKEVGMPVENLLLGSQIEAMSDDELAVAVAASSVFARLAPAHKERIIRALQSKDHVVGFMGDGINDAPALKAADVGISVDSAVDIAKESSDIILLENNLLILEQGVLEGRRVFGNIIKYIKMAASSSFGNMLSVVGASVFLPFLPMLPIQVLINNLLYDFSQTTIPTDEVDADWLTKPRKWAIGEIERFILFFGPISSIFDYLTFFIMLYLFNSWQNPALFHTGWFVESIFTQTLIIHIIRTNRIPFIESRASWQLIATSLIIVAVGALLTVSPLADTLGFVALPPLYWLLLAIMLLCYMILTQLVKTWFIRKFGE
ncbi:magnesium-translocating P-type ATPase [Candidatus Nitrotoga sp. 1052]|uniref:magnesium-translocating P-type ATPase n=1 Tax=Candidatus Nitrotoga sp. 1052 TaxID=2886964 RepID=UPI001EF67C58|nr:magnesium-translocating P-type ATPase [Candidatus Nitrotoga sp. 1052]CAH1085529.1 Mg(2(+)) importing P-type ATPase [Candidatus Nitrotoga sp. 1052]